jgi:glycosyltransferase involved in cell wall biosynthesis
MRVAVVTPYHKRHDEFLSQCLASVASQTHTNCFHVLVGDGCDSADVQISDRVHKISISHNIGDYGDSPRTLGVVYAFAQGADAVAFLDSDNWYEPDHVESLLALQRSTGAKVTVSYRNLAHLDGGILGLCPDSNGISFCDTSCMLFTRFAAEAASSWWTIPKEFHAIDDRIIWNRVLSRRHSIACTRRATVNYRTAFRHHYTMFGEQPPSGAKIGEEIGLLRDEMLKLERRAAMLAPTLTCTTKTTD